MSPWQLRLEIHKNTGITRNPRTLDKKFDSQTVSDDDQTSYNTVVCLVMSSFMLVNLSGTSKLTFETKYVKRGKFPYKRNIRQMPTSLILLVVFRDNLVRASALNLSSHSPLLQTFSSQTPNKHFSCFQIQGHVIINHSSSTFQEQKLPIINLKIPIKIFRFKFPGNPCVSGEAFRNFFQN